MALFGGLFRRETIQQPPIESVPIKKIAVVNSEVKTKETEQSQLLQIMEKIKADTKVYAEILKQLLERNPDQFESIEQVQTYFESAVTSTDAHGVAKLIDQTLGNGTFRTLSFLDDNQNAAKSVFKLLKGNIENTSYEKLAEKGIYLGAIETYGVQWGMEKASRDCLQNFFDANGHTLTGVDVKTAIEEIKVKKDLIKPDEEKTEDKEEVGEESEESIEMEDVKKDDYRVITQTKNATLPEQQNKKVGRVFIEAPQNFDWRELMHFGGSTKDSLKDVGGFGEGLKVSAFVLLKDFGATQVKAASRDWELDYYFKDLPKDAYGKPVKGLHAKKRRREKQEGNYLEIIFEGDDVEEKVQAFEKAREFFYSSENTDFQEASFNDMESGGFKILPPDETKSYDKHQKGRLYLAGQRSYYNDREKWETLGDVNVWTWLKVQPKDRDRGMITYSEMKSDVLPLIVESMSIDDLKKSVYDFKILWDQFSIISVGEDLLKKIVERLVKEKIILEFPSEYISNDAPWQSWLTDALKAQGFKLCGSYMKEIGMKSAKEQFKDLQSHYRVEAEPTEQEKIELLQEAAKKIGLLDDEVKEVWLFSEKDEKNIFSGQYNNMYYWLSKELMSGDFFEVLNVYVHEAAHKEGPHGEAKFEYYLEQCKQKITKFILEHKSEWDKLEIKWRELNKSN